MFTAAIVASILRELEDNIAADALAPSVANSSAAIIFDGKYDWVIVFHNE